ncbi:MAG: helix-turn-helix transcriptional regulator [Desulforhopalus sp.]|nr:helix-turn-helix transcriptional regulator [Desulforhopalus sp.]
MNKAFAEIQIGRETYLLVPANLATAGLDVDRRAVVGEMRIGDANFMVVHPHAGQPAQNATEVAFLLTRRELQIAMLVAEGLVNKQIADQLKISEWTVATHLRRIFNKLQVTSRAAMVNRCFETLRRVNARHPVAPKA